MDATVSNSAGFHVVFRADLGGHRFLYNAEIDGVAYVKGESRELSDLRLVEAKMRYRYRSPYPQEELNIYIQCFLAGVDKLILGLKGKNGMVAKIEERYIDKSKESPDEAIAFFKKVMDMVDAEMSDISVTEKHFVINEGLVQCHTPRNP